MEILSPPLAFAILLQGFCLLTSHSLLSAGLVPSVTLFSLCFYFRGFLPSLSKPYLDTQPSGA